MILLPINNNDKLFFKIWRNKYLNRKIFENLLELSENQATSLQDRIKIKDIVNLELIVKKKKWGILKDILICDRTMMNISESSIEGLISNYPNLENNQAMTELLQLFINKKRKELEKFKFQLVEISISNYKYDLATVFINNGYPTSDFTNDLVYTLYQRNPNNIENSNFKKLLESNSNSNYSDQTKKFVKYPVNLEFIDKNKVKVNEEVIDENDLSQLIEYGRINKALELIRNNNNNNNKLDLNKVITPSNIIDIIEFGNMEFMKELVNHGLDKRILLVGIEYAYEVDNIEMVEFILSGGNGNGNGGESLNEIRNNAFYLDGDFNNEMNEYFNNVKEYYYFNSEVAFDEIGNFRERLKTFSIDCLILSFLQKAFKECEMSIRSIWANKVRQYPIASTPQGLTYLNTTFNAVQEFQISKYLEFRNQVLNNPNFTLDEFHLKMRSILDSISNHEDITSQIVNGIYAIEKRKRKRIEKIKKIKKYSIITFVILILSIILKLTFFK